MIRAAPRGLNTEEAARRFAALGDPTRLQVFQLIARQPLSVGEVAQHLPVSRPAVSQHLRVLADAGLVSAQAAGTRRLYQPASDAVATLRDFIDSLWDVALARFAAEAARAALGHSLEASTKPTAAPTHSQLDRTTHRRYRRISR